MPINVDREKVKRDILLAFQRCCLEKPLNTVTVRDVALKAGISHGKLLYHFESKYEMITEYIRVFSVEYDLFSGFATKVPEGISPKKCAKMMIEEIYRDANEELYNPMFSQIYDLAHYDENIKEILNNSEKKWLKSIENIFSRTSSADPVGDAEKFYIIYEGILTTKKVFDLKLSRALAMADIFPE